MPILQRAPGLNARFVRLIVAFAGFVPFVASAQFSTIYHFRPQDGTAANNPVTIRADGKLFGASTSGGAHGTGTIYSVNADGTGFTVLKSFDSSSGVDCRAGVILGSDGRLYGATNLGGSTGNGTLFRLDADGQNFTVLRALAKPEGEGIWAGLVQGADGMLYGAAASSTQLGTLFRIATDGTGFQVLRSFTTDASEGGTPQGTPTFGSDGKLYGTTFRGGIGGINGAGVVYRMNPDGSDYTVIHAFVGADGANPWGGLRATADGKLYGLTTFGGAFGGGVVYALNLDGSGFVVLRHLAQTNPEGRHGANAVPIIVGERLYASASFGGTGGGGSIFSLKLDGSDFAVEISFTGANGGLDGFTPLAGVRVAPNGALFGTTRNGGSFGGGTLFRLGAAVIAPPVITSGTFTNGGYATPFHYSILATNSPTSYGVSNLPPSLTFDPATGVIDGMLPGTPGVYTLGLSATNGGGTGTSTLIITVTDPVPPVITAPALVSAEATDANGAAVSFSASAVDAISGPLAVTATPASGSIFGLGMSSVALSATDAAGNRAEKSLLVHVKDTTPPTLSLPGNMTVEATNPAGAQVTFSGSATDAVSGLLPVLFAPASNSLFALGATTVTAQAVDAANNVSQASFTVQVVDTTAPTLTLPSNQTLEATSASGAVATFSATATDLASAPSLTYSHASGTRFPIGTTTVTVTAQDAGGLTTSGAFTITVRDTTAPAFTSLTASRTSLWPANHQLVPVTLNAVASDDVGIASLKIISVTSNEPDNGLGDGDTAGDIEITGDLSLNLRAERAGGGNGRSYTIVVEAKDAAALSITRTVSVAVPKNQSAK